MAVGFVPFAGCVAVSVDSGPAGWAAEGYSDFGSAPEAAVEAEELAVGVAEAWVEEQEKPGLGGSRRQMAGVRVLGLAGLSWGGLGCQRHYGCSAERQRAASEPCAAVAFAVAALDGPGPEPGRRELELALPLLGPEPWPVDYSSLVVVVAPSAVVAPFARGGVAAG